MDATSGAAEAARRLRLPVVCPDADAAQGFIQTATGAAEPAARGAVEIERIAVELFELCSDPEREPRWRDAVATADGAVLLGRSLDGPSIVALTRRHECLKSAAGTGIGVFLFREPGERGFKISCWDCGQKLYVDDAEVGKRGSCVSCGRGFRIGTPTEYLRSALGLPDSTPILCVTRGDASVCRGALAHLLARLGIHVSTGPGGSLMHRDTVSIQVRDGRLDVG
jgi:hypothetical protein